MSAEVPTPPADRSPPRSKVVKSNRQQVLLYVFLTLILTVATVWGGRTLLKDSETRDLCGRRSEQRGSALCGQARGRAEKRPFQAAAEDPAQRRQRQGGGAVRPPRSRSCGAADRCENPAAGAHDRDSRSRSDSPAQPRQQEDQILRRSEEAEEDRGLGRRRQQRRLCPQRLRSCRKSRDRLEGTAGAARFDPGQIVCLRLWRGDRGRTRLPRDAGQELRAISPRRAVSP